MNLLDRFNVSLNFYFFRTLSAFILFVLIMSQLSGMDYFLSKIFSFPNLRHEVYISDPNIERRTLDLVVKNSGYGVANNVYIHAIIEIGTISDIKIDSQEAYEIKQKDIENGKINILLKRMASGALINIKLSGSNLSLDGVSISAVSDEGSSSELPGLTEQADTYSTGLTNLFSQAKVAIRNSPSVKNTLEILDKNPVANQVKMVFSNQEFRVVTTSALFVIFVIGMLFPKAYFVIPYIVSFVIFIFFDFQIPASIGIILILTIFIVYFFGPMFPMFRTVFSRSKENPKIIRYYRDVFMSLGLFVLLGLSAAWFFAFYSFSFNWIIVPIVFFFVKEIVSKIEKEINKKTNPISTQSLEKSIKTIERRLDTSLMEIDKKIEDIKEFMGKSKTNPESKDTINEQL